MKLTLLDYVQSILSSLGSDEVNSISDNAEAMQVAEIVKTTYFNVISRTDLPEQYQLVQLDPSINTTSPVLMYIPEGIRKVEWIKYYNSSNLTQQSTSTFQHSLNVDVTSSGNGGPTPQGYEYVTILPVQQFLDMTNGFNPANSNIETFTLTSNVNGYPGTYTFYYKTDKQPQYCCVLSDYYVVFDGYNSYVDDTLQSSKSMCYGQISPFWRMKDDFIPNLDEQQVPLLLNEAKSLAFFEMKQMAHTKAEQESRRQWSAVQRDKNKVNKPSYFDRLPDMGRQRTHYTGFSLFKARGWDRP